MRFDVSELKTFNECQRKWQLSSRNAYHLRPKATNENLLFGSLFHEALHALYLGADPEKVLERGLRELTDEVQRRVFTNMLMGYAEKVLPADLEEYCVIDVEHEVHLRLPELQSYDERYVQTSRGVSTYAKLNEEDSIEICGSIDMIVVRRADNSVWGFEHKTASKFRPEIYIAMDEQPRVYFLELQQLVARMNQRESTTQSRLYKVGGIIINEIKKVQRTFEYARHSCIYSQDQIMNFRRLLVDKGTRIRNARENVLVYGESGYCNPSYMKCQMCEFAPICTMYGYDDISKEDILDEFCEEFEVREVDHLDEKVERRFADCT